jgi:hypothetical protein
MKTSLFFLVAHSEAVKDSLVLLEVKLTQNQNSLGTDISQRPVSFENIKSFPLEELIKHFCPPLAPQGEVSCVQIFQYLF